jgi:hypothetical protein
LPLDRWGSYGFPNSLTYAPTPDSILNAAFSKDQIVGDLDEIIRRQEEDGRWKTDYGISEGYG